MKQLDRLNPIEKIMTLEQTWVAVHRLIAAGVLDEAEWAHGLGELDQKRKEAEVERAKWLREDVSRFA